MVKLLQTLPPVVLLFAGLLAPNVSALRSSAPQNWVIKRNEGKQSRQKMEYNDETSAPTCEQCSFASASCKGCPVPSCYCCCSRVLCCPLSLPWPCCDQAESLSRCDLKNTHGCFAQCLHGHTDHQGAVSLCLYNLQSCDRECFCACAKTDKEAREIEYHFDAPLSCPCLYPCCVAGEAVCASSCCSGPKCRQAQVCLGWECCLSPCSLLTLGLCRAGCCMSKQLACACYQHCDELAEGVLRDSMKVPEQQDMKTDVVDQAMQQDMKTETVDRAVQTTPRAEDSSSSSWSRWVGDMMDQSMSRKWLINLNSLMDGWIIRVLILRRWFCKHSSFTILTKLKRCFDRWLRSRRSNRFVPCNTLSCKLLLAIVRHQNLKRLTSYKNGIKIQIVSCTSITEFKLLHDCHGINSDISSRIQLSG